MSGYSRGSGGDESGNRYSNKDYQSERSSSSRNNNDSNDSGQKRNYSDQQSRGSGGGYGSGGGGDYNRGRRGQDESTDSGYNRGRNERSSGGDDSGMETQRDTVFIQNLPRNITEDQLNEVFKQIGMIKNDRKTGLPKIWIYKDKATGEGKGEATITYDDEEAAQAAITWYNNKEVLSSVVKVSLATRRASAFGGGRGGSRGRGGFRGRGGGDFGGYRGRGGDRGGGGDYRGGGRGASFGSSRDHRSNPY